MGNFTLRKFGDSKLPITDDVTVQVGRLEGKLMPAINNLM